MRLDSDQLHVSYISDELYGHVMLGLAGLTPGDAVNLKLIAPSNAASASGATGSFATAAPGTAVAGAAAPVLAGGSPFGSFLGLTSGSSTLSASGISAGTASSSSSSLVSQQWPPVPSYSDTVTDGTLDYHYQRILQNSALPEADALAQLDNFATVPLDVLQASQNRNALQERLQAMGALAMFNLKESESGHFPPGFKFDWTITLTYHGRELSATGYAKDNKKNAKQAAAYIMRRKIAYIDDVRFNHDSSRELYTCTKAPSVMVSKAAAVSAAVAAGAPSLTAIMGGPSAFPLGAGLSTPLHFNLGGSAGLIPNPFPLTVTGMTGITGITGQTGAGGDGVAVFPSSTAAGAGAGIGAGFSAGLGATAAMTDLNATPPSAVNSSGSGSSSSSGSLPLSSSGSGVPVRVATRVGEKVRAAVAAAAADATGPWLGSAAAHGHLAALDAVANDESRGGRQDPISNPNNTVTRVSGLNSASVMSDIDNNESTSTDSTDTSSMHLGSGDGECSAVGTRGTHCTRGAAVSDEFQQNGYWHTFNTVPVPVPVPSWVSFAACPLQLHQHMTATNSSSSSSDHRSSARAVDGSTLAADAAAVAAIARSSLNSAAVSNSYSPGTSHGAASGSGPHSSNAGASSASASPSSSGSSSGGASYGGHLALREALAEVLTEAYQPYNSTASASSGRAMMSGADAAVAAASIVSAADLVAVQGGYLPALRAVLHALVTMDNTTTRKCTRGKKSKGHSSSPSQEATDNCKTESNSANNSSSTSSSSSMCSGGTGDTAEEREEPVTVLVQEPCKPETLQLLASLRITPIPIPLLLPSLNSNNNISSSSSASATFGNNDIALLTATLGSATLPPPDFAQLPELLALHRPRAVLLSSGGGPHGHGGAALAPEKLWSVLSAAVSAGCWVVVDESGDLQTAAGATEMGVSLNPQPIASDNASSSASASARVSASACVDANDVGTVVDESGVFVHLSTPGSSLLSTRLRAMIVARVAEKSLVTQYQDAALTAALSTLSSLSSSSPTNATLDPATAAAVANAKAYVAQLLLPALPLAAIATRAINTQQGGGSHASPQVSSQVLPHVYRRRGWPVLPLGCCVSIGSVPALASLSPLSWIEAHPAVAAHISAALAAAATLPAAPFFTDSTRAAAADSGAFVSQSQSLSLAMSLSQCGGGGLAAAALLQALRMRMRRMTMREAAAAGITSLASATTATAVAATAAANAAGGVAPGDANSTLFPSSIASVGYAAATTATVDGPWRYYTVYNVTVGTRAAALVHSAWAHKLLSDTVRAVVNVLNRAKGVLTVSAGLTTVFASQQQQQTRNSTPVLKDALSVPDGNIWITIVPQSPLGAPQSYNNNNNNNNNDSNNINSFSSGTKRKKPETGAELLAALGGSVRAVLGTACVVGPQSPLAELARRSLLLRLAGADYDSAIRAARAIVAEMMTAV